jgi:uncharacterized membrane protein
MEGGDVSGKLHDRPREAGPAGDPDTEMKVRETDAIDRVVRAVLGTGLVISGVLLVAGFIVWLAGRGSVPASVHGPITAARDLVRLQPIGFFSWGLLVLILTPFARVIGTLVVFLRLHDWRFAAVSSGVLAGMLTALVIAAF